MNVLPAAYVPTSAVNTIYQSPPISLETPYSASWLRGKTVLITGGASGFGAGFVQKWAASGACVILGDINTANGDKLARETRKETGNQNVHFLHCNVTDWQSQVQFFKEAVKLSPHGGIDIVVANAGVAGVDDFEMPKGLDAAEPPKPNFKTLDVNLTGVLYTTHLALFYLPKNPNSKPCNSTLDPKSTPRDRCLILVGSMASLSPIPSQPLYGVSKHGVLGLFRSLRATSFVHGVRVNIICPYFIATPIVEPMARILLAGGATGKPEDVIEAATRLAADSRILGRSLYVGPKMTLKRDENGVCQLVTKNGQQQGQEGSAIWEAYAEDYDDTELFGRNVTRLLNQFTVARGWAGYVSDMYNAVAYAVGFGGKVK